MFDIHFVKMVVGGVCFTMTGYLDPDTFLGKDISPKTRKIVRLVILLLISLLMTL